MRSICFITLARSDYGLIKWILKDLRSNDLFDPMLIVSGTHLLKEQGNTIQEIENDEMVISEILQYKSDLSTPSTIACTNGELAISISEAFTRLQPDYICVLGDRYELLPICSTALIMDIPVIHISGGDVTEGAIDNSIRNAVTMMADYHFAGTVHAAENIKRMRGSSRNVWIVGEPGLDEFFRTPLKSRTELADIYGLDPDKDWCMLTWHPETRRTSEYNMDAIKNCVTALDRVIDGEIAISYANADADGKLINEYLESDVRSLSSKFHVIPSFGHLNYLSYIKQCTFVIGNSSSGIVETPLLGIPAINLGDRQKGRHQCRNIIQCTTDLNDIKDALSSVSKMKPEYDDMYYWGTGHASESIVSILESELGKV